MLALLLPLLCLASCEEGDRNIFELDHQDAPHEDLSEFEELSPPQRWQYVSVRRPDGQWYGAVDAIGVRKPSGEYRWSWQLVEYSDLAIVPTPVKYPPMIFPPDTYLAWPSELDECNGNGAAYSFFTTTRTIGVGVWGGFEKGDTVVIVLACSTSTPTDLEVMVHAEPVRKDGPIIRLQKIPGSFPLMLEYAVPELPPWPRADEVSP